MADYIRTHPYSHASLVAQQQETTTKVQVEPDGGAAVAVLVRTLSPAAAATQVENDAKLAALLRINK